ncbi:ATP-binding cassette domain-containing protein [Clostridium paraputrificum]|uniref:ABC transporter ATP-binding protein n=1 Tax=Clostridium paraputrificum TaxID=29363 RepID=A0A1B8RKC5_9CLOT|nr:MULTISPECIES: ATP-binding cassette domain-containing protein [Clostridium]MDB2073262.1 ATP-binding cassette domain-containing protein [Clostridium paraputrificum]MDB2081649.1 ATP-binding cassette domain-containing protein [Clostridium paraputrificum]MDB2090544.1 ATP-binding cassette domain-containing protein [Clostridium paraputrificum]MDB2097159.1 ATP-binding cassette domain-containing protein [Clostridium paraputrificum]MDB2104373.1 ATP-binding cassette domain-containing protein [Clostrid
MKLEVKNIKKTFGETEVLHGISFSISSGKALGLLGRNGAGKTTTIRILMDVFKANEGEIIIDGKKFNPKDFQIGYLPEERGLYPKKKVIDQLMYLGNLRGISLKEAKTNGKFWLKRLGIEEYENRLLETLSKGNQQKVQLAQTLVCNPEIVILDEPFSGLDPVNAQILKDVVTDLIQDGKLVIFSSHQMNYVEEFCEDIAIINKGDVVLSGNLKDIKKDFGKNKLMLSANNYFPIELKEKCEEYFGDIIRVDEVMKEFVILELKESRSKNDLLSEIIKSDIDVEKFGEYEPSLNDIFVLKAGDE